MESVSEMPIATASDISHRQCFQYPFNETESKFLGEKLHSLLKNKVIKKSKTEPGDFVCLIFVRGKSVENFRLILNLR